MGRSRDRSTLALEERLASLALDRGFITPTQLRTALDFRDREGLTLSESFLSHGFLTAGQIMRLMAETEHPHAHPPVGRFTIVREVGRGTSAIVLEALDTADGRRVALKVFHPGPAADVDRFVREGGVAAGIPLHPGIVAVRETGEHEGRRYLVMDLIDGLHLDQWIRRGSVGFPAYVQVLRDAALAVDHAHRVGVIHRDLKPENILVDAEGRARVTDFGLAKTVATPMGTSVTATGITVGTPAYMSPEQILGRRDVDHRADVWALGVMLYEALVGARPFDGATAFEAMTKAVTEAPPPPLKSSRLRWSTHLFGTLEKITLKALAKDPKERYATARAFADDLTRWLKGERFDVDLPPAPPPAPPKKRRVRKAVALSASALAGAVLAAAILLPRAGEPPRPALLPAAPAGMPGAILDYCGGIQFNTLGKREIDVRPGFGNPADPVWPDGPEYYVSLRWTGRLRVPKTGAYRFTVRAPEGARLVVARTEILSNLVPHAPTDRSGRVVLERGFHDVVLEVFHSGAPEEVAVAWGLEGRPSLPLGPSGLTHDPAAFTPVAAPAINGPVLIPGAQEGESLPVVDASGRETVIQAFAPFRWFWRGRWSGDAHLWWGSGARKGDSLTVRFNSPSAGRRSIVLGLTRSMDHGIFSLAVNGRPAGDLLDLYSPDLATQEVDLPNVLLRAGANELTFRAVDIHPAAREWSPGAGLFKMGLDYVLVR
jgi:hypothetical protein